MPAVTVSDITVLPRISSAPGAQPRTVKSITTAPQGFEGEIVFNSNKPDGTPRKLTDISKLKSLGFQHTVHLNEGIQRLIHWYLGQSK